MADVPASLTPGRKGDAITGVLIGVAVTIGLVALLALILAGSYIALWLQAALSKAPVSFIEIIGMRLRRVDPRTIVLAYIRATRVGLEVSANQLTMHYLASGDVPRVVNAMIAAHRGGIDLSFDSACATDLAGRDVLEEVRELVDLEATDSPIAAVGEAEIDAGDESIERWPPEGPEA